ncbi:hypothetical protein ABZS66_28000 [Dactylosporangium sp. NPDC005572]|uniref:hypothetical protein n=1 Tax=Dactylosporangium sp. NPDC005572 TaxID=3156889 RepID=UPI0033A9B244
MSTWIVSRDHLDLLITAGLQWNLTTEDDADDIGRTLWRENLARVAYHYPSDVEGGPAPSDFHDRDVQTYRFRAYWTGSIARRWATELHEQATARTPAYLAEYGPVDPARQARGEAGWYVLIDQHGDRKIRSSDGWSVPDRDVFNRAAALRVAPWQSLDDAAASPQVR